MKRFIFALFILSIGCHSVEYQAPLDDESGEQTTVVFADNPAEEGEEQLEFPEPEEVKFEEEMIDDPIELENPELPETRGIEEEQREERRSVEEETPEQEPEPEETPEPEQEVVDDVTVDEQIKIDNLRTAIFAGLDIGRYVYLEEVSLRLQNLGIITNYEESFVPEWTILESEDCPFTKYYDNKPDVNESLCEYLLDSAKADVYSELVDILDSLPMPAEIEEQYMEEAMFWLEQGAISGIEENRVLIRNDIKLNNICNQAPTVAESSHDKGIIEGRQHFINNFNAWLDKNGYIPDYPAMSEPIEVCNADVSMLDPARKDALKSISKALEEKPLCEDFEPSTLEMQVQYAQANLDYSKALKEGVENEFALAAVKVFKVIPCNVSDPLILDLNGNGIFDITTIQDGVNFDMHVPDRPQAMAWTNGDGFLFLDRNGNGVADDGLEFFGNTTKFRDGFRHLAIYDDNKDKVLDEKDSQYQNVYIWNDFDMNGICTENEVMSLQEFGITSLNVTGVETNIRVAGGRIKYTSLALIDGISPILVGDAFLQSASYAKLSR